MKGKYNEYKQLKLTELADDIRQWWETDDIFRKSIETRQENQNTYFTKDLQCQWNARYSSCNGKSNKDIFCRYKTLKDFRLSAKQAGIHMACPLK